MLLSRIDEGRAVPVDPQAGSTRAAVAHQLDMLLGEHLLPLRTRRTPDEPHLLAVDASGQPVVVEVVGLLDAEVCLRALRHAGAAARMTSADIAAAYRGGAAAFPAHFEAFRSTVLASSQLSPLVRSGARLMLVCTEVDPAVDDVLEFLLQPGWQVEVLCVRVTTDSRGTKVADVVPVERSAPSRDPWRAPGAGPEPQPLPRRKPAAPPSTGPPRPTTPSSSEQRRPTARADHRGARPAAVVPEVVAPAFAVVRGAGTTTERPAEQGGGAAPRQGVQGRAMPERATQARPQGQAAPAAVDVVTAAAPDPVDPDVAELAALMGGPVNLVWETGDGGRHEVLLHVDGRIELPDGTVVGDVAEAAARLHGPVPDARAVWHVGDHHGPTLADLLT